MDHTIREPATTTPFGHTGYMKYLSLKIIQKMGLNSIAISGQYYGSSYTPVSWYMFRKEEVIWRGLRSLTASMCSFLKHFLKKFMLGPSQLSCLRRRKFWNGFVWRMNPWMGWSWCLVLGKKTVTWFCINRWVKFTFMRWDFWNSASIVAIPKAPFIHMAWFVICPMKFAFVLLGMLLYSTVYTVADWRQSGFWLYCLLECIWSQSALVGISVVVAFFSVGF